MDEKLHCLGIEGTAHTFGIGIVSFDSKKLNKQKILCNVKDSFTSEEGGMIPNVVAEHHSKVANKVLEKALKTSNLKIEDIDLIAFSQGPGLAPCLLETMNFAKQLAINYNKPIVGVNHIAAHLEIGKQITQVKDPIYLFVSGANTQIIIEDSDGKNFRILGECLSSALGNALDKFARNTGLGFPGGPKIEELAKTKGAKYIELPYAVKGMDVDFSGIATKAEQLLKKGSPKEDLCYSLQETCFSMLAEVTERAMAHTGKRECIVIGGVAANKRFCEMLDNMCKSRGAIFYPVPLEYCGDNGAMIASRGVIERAKAIKGKDIETRRKLDIKPRWRIDDI